MDPSAESPSPAVAASAPPAAPVECAPTSAPLPSGGPLPAPTGPGFDVTRQQLGLNRPPVYSPAVAAAPYPPPPYAQSPYPPPPYPAPYGAPGAMPYSAQSQYSTAYPYPAPPPAYGGSGGNPPPPPAPPGGSGGSGAGEGGFGGLFGESFFVHIDELRKRVLRSVLALIIAASLVSFYMQELNHFVQQPMESQRRDLCEKMIVQSEIQKGKDDDSTRVKFDALIGAESNPAEQARLKELFQAELRWNEIQLEARRLGGITAGKIRSKGPVGPFTYLVDLILYTSVLLAAPYWLWEIWGFVSPALYRREKMAIAPIFLFGLVLFLIGAAFGYVYVLPISFNYLMDLGMWLDFEPWYDIGEYFSFCFMVTICFGLSFELPLVCIMLGKLGFLSHTTLIKYWKWMIFGAFFLGGILTPPDVMSQVMMAGVLIVLYLVSIVGVWIVYPRPPVE